jgi:hypothetical protein
VFASPTTDGNALKNKKWHVGADFATKLGQLVASKSLLMHLVQRKQSRCRVAAASAQTSAMRDALSQVDLNTGLNRDGGEVSACSPHDKVPIVRGKSGIIAGELDARRRIVLRYRDIIEE